MVNIWKFTGRAAPAFHEGFCIIIVTLEKGTAPKLVQSHYNHFLYQQVSSVILHCAMEHHGLIWFDDSW